MATARVIGVDESMGVSFLFDLFVPDESVCFVPAPWS
jgi:hypothetical protein